MSAPKLRYAVLGFGAFMGLFLFTMVACGLPTEATNPRPGAFNSFYKEAWGGWDWFVIRHASGACFVVLDIPGDGGGALTAAPEEVCKYHESVEKK